MNSIATVAVLAALAFAGCGDEATPTDPPPSRDGPLVTYSRSGGFSPVAEQLVVEPDGGAVLETGFVGGDRKHVAFELPPADLDAVIDALDAAPLDAFVQGPAACADCYAYSIETGGEKIELTDADLMEGSGSTVPNEIFALLDELGGIVEERRPAP